jgi:hypothetical protein
MKELYKDPATIEIEQRMNLYRVHSDEEWQNALQTTHEQGRVALMIRTPKCNFNRDQAIEKIIMNMGLS